LSKIKNSLTSFLDDKLPTNEDVEEFLDNLEHEILGFSNREFYLKYKGDIKELIEEHSEIINDLSFEKELLKGLLAYAKQRRVA